MEQGVHGGELLQACMPTVGPHAAIVASDGSTLGLQTKMMKAKGLAPGSGFDTQKSNLNGSCMRILKRNLAKGEVKYQTTKVVGGFQSEVTVFCLSDFWGVKTFVGHTMSDSRKAEHSAAQVALERILADPILLAEHEKPGHLDRMREEGTRKKDKKSRIENGGQDDGSGIKLPGWNESQGSTEVSCLQYVPVGFAHHNHKVELNEMCTRIARHRMQKGGISYENKRVKGGFQTDVTLHCFADIWGTRTFVGEVGSTQNDGEQSAARLAKEAILSDATMSALYEKHNWHELPGWKKGDKGIGKGKNKRDNWDFLEDWLGGKGETERSEHSPSSGPGLVPMTLSSGDAPIGSSEPASAKDELYAACCTIAQRDVLVGSDIVYNTQKAMGNRFQSTVTLPCIPDELGAVPFAGAIRKSEEDAEESAAKIALDSLHEDDGMGLMLKARANTRVSDEEPSAKRQRGERDLM